MATRKAALVVTISGDTKQLDRALIKAGGGVDQFGRRVEHANTRVGGSFATISKRAVGAGAAMVGAYASIAGAKKAIDTTTTLAKTTLALHRNLGLSVEQSSRWAAVAKSRDVDSKALNQTFVVLSKNIAANAKEFDKLGISRSELKNDDFDSILKKSADGLAALPAGAERAALSAKLFGRGWQAIVPILRGGSKEMDAQLKLADKYGVTFKGKTVKSLEDLTKAQRESRFATMGLQVAFGTQLAPALTKGINAGSKFVAQMRSGKGAGGEFAKTLKGVWEEAKPIVQWLGRAAAAVAKFVDKHPEVGKLAAAVIGVGAAVKTLKFVSAATGFTDLLKAGRAASRGLKRILASGGAAAGEAAVANAASGFTAKSVDLSAAGKKSGRTMGKAIVGGALLAIPLLIWEFKDAINKIVEDFSHTTIGKILTAPNKLGGKLGTAIGSILGTNRKPDAVKHIRLKAVGGWIGRPGESGPDDQIVWAGRGEAFLNRHQQAPVNFALAYTAAAQGGPASLDELFASVRTPHTRGFTGGGIVGHANAIDSKHYPYVWGGGHGQSGVPSGGPPPGYDCSGAVSAVLGVSPRVSGQFTSFGLPGAGAANDTKIYANAKHVFAVLNGRGWGTSAENPGGGPGWLSYNNRSGFTIRHLNDGGSSNHGGRRTGDPQETSEPGKSTRRERQERAGSRLVNRVAARFAPVISSATRRAESLGTQIEDAGTSYGQAERKYGQTDEDLGTPEGRAKRLDEIGELRNLKRKQLNRQKKRATALRKAIGNLEKLLRQGHAARAKAKGAKRAKINERLRAYDARLTDLKAELKALGFAVKDTELDIGDLAKEAGDVAATPGTDAAEGSAPTDLLGQALSDIDLQERAGVLSPEQAQAARIATLQRALAGGFGALDQRQQWEIMGQLREATSDLAQATADATSAIRDLKASIDAQLAFADRVSAVTSMEAVRALSDVMSGQLGARVVARGSMPGSGSLSRF